MSDGGHDYKEMRTRGWLVWKDDGDGLERGGKKPRVMGTGVAMFLYPFSKHPYLGWCFSGELSLRLDREQRG